MFACHTQDEEGYIKLEISKPILYNATDLTATMAAFALVVRGFTTNRGHLLPDSKLCMVDVAAADGQSVCLCIVQLLGINRRSLRGDGWGSGPREAKTVSNPAAPTSGVVTRSSSSRRPRPLSVPQHGSSSGSSGPTVYTAKGVQLGMPSKPSCSRLLRHPMHPCCAFNFAVHVLLVSVKPIMLL